MENISPLQHITRGAATVSGQGVTISDQSMVGKLQVEGASAEKVLAAAFGAAPTQNAGVEVVDGVMIGRITPSRYLLITKQGGAADAAAKVESAVGDAFITVSPQTNGQAMIHMSGERSQALFSKLCGLDFDSAEFPVNCVKISSLAKIRVNIWHTEDGYQLYCGRSYSEYLWQTIRQAGVEFGL